MISKTLRLEHSVGNYLTGSSEWVIRLYGDDDHGGKIGWVDFIIIHVAACNEAHTIKYYNKNVGDGPQDMTEKPDEAVIDCSGFVKWDGCTQFSIEHIHIDDRSNFELFVTALLLARELAASIMTTETSNDYIKEEYPYK